MTDIPETGGRWMRDPKTGALTPITDNPAVDTPELPVPAATPQPAKPAKGE